MARKILNIGVIANDGKGDRLREAFSATQDNTAELYNFLGGDELTSLKARQKLNVPSVGDVALSLTPKADLIYVNAAIGALSTDAGKQYATLALANADIANIPLNKNIFVSEAANGGYWFKASASATSLSKSAFSAFSQTQALSLTYTYSTYAEFDAAKSTLPANCTVVIGESNTTGTGQWDIGNNRWNGNNLVKSAFDPKTQAVQASNQYTDEKTGNLQNLNDSTEYSSEFELNESVSTATTDKDKNPLYYIKGGKIHFIIPIEFVGNNDLSSLLSAFDNSYTLLNDSKSEFELSENAHHSITDENKNILFSINQHLALNQLKKLIDNSYEILNSEEYELNPLARYTITDKNLDVLFSVQQHIELLNLVKNFKSSVNPYVPFVNTATSIAVLNTETGVENIISTTDQVSSPRQLEMDAVMWDSNNIEVPTYYAKAPYFKAYPIKPRPHICVWGHSFTENPVMARTLANLTGLKVYNFGKSGLQSRGIAGRRGNQSFKFKPTTGLIPASGSVTLDAQTANEKWLLVANSASHISNEELKGTFAGIDGYIKWDGTNLTFYRTTAGTAVTINQLTDFVVKHYTTQSTAQVPANTLYEQSDECINVFWIGRNNIGQFDTILNDYKNMIDAFKTLGKRFVILSEFTSSTDSVLVGGELQAIALNRKLKELYPENYCEIDGIDLFQYFLNHHNPNFAGDVEDVAVFKSPRTLRYDNLHPSLSKIVGANGASPFAEYALWVGAEIIAEFIYQFLLKKGWV